jgi:hypothetical protein
MEQSPILSLLHPCSPPRWIASSLPSATTSPFSPQDSINESDQSKLDAGGLSCLISVQEMPPSITELFLRKAEGSGKICHFLKGVFCSSRQEGRFV